MSPLDGVGFRPRSRLNGGVDDDREASCKSTPARRYSLPNFPRRILDFGLGIALRVWFAVNPSVAIIFQIGMGNCCFRLLCIQQFQSLFR